MSNTIVAMHVKSAGYFPRGDVEQFEEAKHEWLLILVVLLGK